MWVVNAGVHLYLPVHLVHLQYAELASVVHLEDRLLLADGTSDLQHARWSDRGWVASGLQFETP